jgi:hypothetical protein
MTKDDVLFGYRQHLFVEAARTSRRRAGVWCAPLGPYHTQSRPRSELVAAAARHSGKSSLTPANTGEKSSSSLSPSSPEPARLEALAGVDSCAPRKHSSSS